MKYQNMSKGVGSRSLLLGSFVIVSLLILASSKNHWTRKSVWISETEATFKEGSIEDTKKGTVPRDQTLGGLLLPDFDEELCVSRYQSLLYRKASPYIVSSYLISKLRAYEELHKKCGPNTPLFLKSLQQLKLNHSTDKLECNYLLWSPCAGIGNRMLTLVSAFLYALLTNRVLLIHRAFDMSDLFCEPFPGSSWYIPHDFPIKHLEGYDVDSQNSYGYMVAHNLINDDPNSPPSSLPPFVYVHLQNEYANHDLHKRFFCEGDQEVIKKINWVLLKSDNYFVPGVFMIPKYEQELERMFPLKETVFHHLGRYLLHPSNSVWRIVMTYNNSYLAKGKERIGIQVRIFNWPPISIDEMHKQIVACTQKELILPEIISKESEGSSLASNNATTLAVLVASLHGEFSKRLKDMYNTQNTSTGKIISVYQPSHEEEQKFADELHNQKAFAEIWLLSFSDVLVTTARSTFGYVSYSLAGIKTWFLLSSMDQKAPDPPCRRAVTIDACFHSPPNFNCKTRSNAFTGSLIRYVQPCEDCSSGVKLSD